jgi:hypothetical protein
MTLPALDIGDGKSSLAAEDGSISMYQGPHFVYLKPDEAQKFKRWLNAVI